MLVRVSPHVSSVVDQNGAVILGISQNEMTILDSMGAYVWGRLTDGIEIEEIVASLVAQTGAASDVVRTDIYEFVGRLVDKGLALESSQRAKHAEL
jgi:hypothetical protein